MTLKRSFIKYLEDHGFGTFATDLFLNGAPLDKTTCWWVIATGGTPIATNQTGEKQKRYILSVFYRSDDAEDVDEQLHALEEHLNSAACIELEDFDTVDVACTTFPTDQDLDVQDRTVGLAQVSIITYL